MDKLVIVLLGICGSVLGGLAYNSWILGLGIGCVLAFVFYYLVNIGR